MLLTLLMLLTTVQFAFSQIRKIGYDELLFEKGLMLQELADDIEADAQQDSTQANARYTAEIKATILDKALDNYEVLIDSFPDSKLLYRALNNKGFTEFALNDKEEARETFLTIIKSKADDKEKGGAGSGIMAEPYANYKNRAAKMLAEIYIEEHNFKEALKYLNLTKKYPYRHFCGNEYAADDIYMSTLYGKCYLGLNDLKKAYDALLPNLIDNGLADNTHLVTITYNALLKTYKKEDLKVLYEQAFKNYKIEKRTSDKDEYEDFYISFLDKKIELNSWRLALTNEDEREKEITKMCRQSQFYKLVNE